MVKAGGVGIFSAIENTELIDFSRRSNVENGKIVPNWNVSETRDFQPACHISFSGNYVILLSDLADRLPTSQTGSPELT
jgi:hypothetical protein